METIDLNYKCYKIYNNNDDNELFVIVPGLPL